MPIQQEYDTILYRTFLKYIHIIEGDVNMFFLVDEYGKPIVVARDNGNRIVLMESSGSFIPFTLNEYGSIILRANNNRYQFLSQNAYPDFSSVDFNQINSQLLNIVNPVADQIKQIKSDILRLRSEKEMTASMEAMKISNEARREAERIKNAALDEAEKIKNEALLEAERIKNETLLEVERLKKEDFVKLLGSLRQEVVSFSNSFLGSVSEMKTNIEKGNLVKLLSIILEMDESVANIKEERALKNLGKVRERFMRVFSSMGVTEIRPSDGDEFDPREHEILDENIHGNDHKIFKLILPGFRMSDTVLIKAVVEVSV